MGLEITVAVALTSAAELGFMLERIDADDPEHADWLAFQAQMLAHWTDVLAEEAPDYPSLAAGLSEFAHVVQHRLRVEDRR